MQNLAIRTVLSSFGAALPGILTVMIPISFLILVFSIIGMELFGGSLKRCACVHDNRIVIAEAADGVELCTMMLNYTQNVTMVVGEIVDMSSCEAAGLSWSSDPAFGDFDNVRNAVVLVISTLFSCYTPVLDMLKDAPLEAYTMPVTDASSTTATSYIFAMHMVFSFFLLNIFIGTISSTFSVRSGKSLITGPQHRWARCSDTALRFNPTLSKQEEYRPEEGAPCFNIRVKLFSMVMHPAWTVVSTAMILLNTVFIATEHYPPISDTYILIVHWANTFLLGWFTLEMFINMGAFGIREFMSDVGMLFDAFIVLASVGYRLAGTPSGFELFKIFRALRLFFLRGGSSSLVNLMSCVTRCLMKTADLVLISFLVIYVYAIIGMQLYGGADLGCGTDSNGDLVECYTNFNSFPNALCALGQIGSGFAFTDFLGPLSADPSNDHDMVIAFCYFASCKFIVVYICVNLFIVSVLDNFGSLTDVDQDIDFDHFWAFTYCWSELTVGAGATPSLRKPEVKSFVRSLRSIVAEHDLTSGRFCLQVSELPQLRVQLANNMEELEDALRVAFNQYGKILTGKGGVDFRVLDGEVSYARITFKDAEEEDIVRAETDNIHINDHALPLQVRRSEAGKYAQGMSTIHIPGQEAGDHVGSFVVRIYAIDAPIRMQPYVRIIATARHRGHGGHDFTRTSRLGESDIAWRWHKKFGAKHDRLERHKQRIKEQEEARLMEELAAARTTAAPQEAEVEPEPEPPEPEHAVEQAKETGAFGFQPLAGASDEVSEAARSGQMAKERAALEAAEKKLGVFGDDNGDDDAAESVELGLSDRMKGGEEAKNDGGTTGTPFGRISTANNVKGDRVETFWVDQKFQFPVNEHSSDLIFTLHDLHDLSAQPLATATIPLDEIRASVKHAHGKSAGKSYSFKCDGEKVLWASKGKKAGIKASVEFDGDDNSVPDFEFLSNYNEDNDDLKPESCGIHGWVWMKAPGSHRFQQRWMYIQEAVNDSSACLCYIDDVDSEFELREEYLDKTLDRRIRTLDASSIVDIKNACSIKHRAKTVHLSKSDIRHIEIEEREFEFTCEGNEDQHHNAMHQATNEHIGAVHVQICSVADLPPSSKHRTLDSYVNVSVNHVSVKKIEKQTKLHSNTVEHTNDPKINESFVLPVEDKKAFVQITVFEHTHPHDVPVGSVDIQMNDLIKKAGQVFDKKLPLKTVTGGSLGGQGSIHVRLTYVARDDEDHAIPAWKRDDIQSGRIKPKVLTYRFRTTSLERKHAWVNALQWLENDCIGGTDGLLESSVFITNAGGYAKLPVAPLSPADRQKVVFNPKTVDLPFGKFRQLIYNLARFECLGVKDTRKWKLHAAFQMELYAYKRHWEQRAKDTNGRKPESSGSTIASFAGLDFSCVLERLCLLRYAKVNSFPYEMQMDEFKRERRCVALHYIQSLVRFWIHLRRHARANPAVTNDMAVAMQDRSGTVLHPIWLQCPNAHRVALEGARNSLMLTLSLLQRAVRDRDPLLHFGSLTEAHLGHTDSRAESVADEEEGDPDKFRMQNPMLIDSDEDDEGVPKKFGDPTESVRISGSATEVFKKDTKARKGKATNAVGTSRVKIVNPLAAMVAADVGDSDEDDAG
jgi:hypothetical protein